MTKQPGRARKSLKERFFDYLTRVVLTRHFQKMKIAKQDTNYIEQQLMIKTNQGNKRIGVVTLQFVDNMTPVDRVNVAEALAVAEQIKVKKLQKKTKSAGYRIALLKEAIMHSNCTLKTVKDIAGLPASVMNFIDCAIGVNDGVLAWKNSLEKPSIIAQDTEQPPKNQEGTTE